MGTPQHQAPRVAKCQNKGGDWVKYPGFKKGREDYWTGFAVDFLMDREIKFFEDLGATPRVRTTRSISKQAEEDHRLWPARRPEKWDFVTNKQPASSVIYGVKLPI